MAWGKPKPKPGKYRQSCTACGYATCRCRKIVAADTRKTSNAAPHRCGRCGRTVRGGVCPGPDC